MANRGATAAVRSEWGNAQTAPVHLFEAYFDDTVVRVTDAPFQITWAGNDYLANGHFLEFSGLEENAGLQETRVNVTLSGVDQFWVREVLALDYLDRRLVIYKGFLNASQALILNPVPIFDGRMDKPGIQEDPDSGKCAVAIEAGWHWTDFGRRPGRHTNDNEQQQLFSGDAFFEFVSEINRQVIWGRGGASTAVAAGTAPRFGAVAPEGTAGLSALTGFGYEP